MSEKEYQRPRASEQISAADLRKRITDKMIAEAKEKAEKARAQDEAARKAYEDFLERRFTEDDRLRARRTIEKAADAGFFEVELIKFPSEYLDDHGRRINNGDRDWHQHLTGYAKATYDAYQDLGQPQGYKLVARVLSYPDGMIGDIGFYVSWKG